MKRYASILIPAAIVAFTAGVAAPVWIYCGPWWGVGAGTAALIFGASVALVYVLSNLRITG